MKKTVMINSITSIENFNIPLKEFEEIKAISIVKVRDEGINIYLQD